MISANTLPVIFFNWRSTFGIETKYDEAIFTCCRVPVENKQGFLYLKILHNHENGRKKECIMTYDVMQYIRSDEKLRKKNSKVTFVLYVAMQVNDKFYHEREVISVRWRKIILL